MFSWVPDRCLQSLHGTPPLGGPECLEPNRSTLSSRSLPNHTAPPTSNPTLSGSPYRDQVTTIQPGLSSFQKSFRTPPLAQIHPWLPTVLRTRPMSSVGPRPSRSHHADCSDPTTCPDPDTRPHRYIRCHLWRAFLPALCPCPAIPSA